MTDRKFPATDLSNVPPPPLSIGLMGPPGGGKTKSALRIGDGISAIRGGKPALIDTEGGRALKYVRGPLNPQGHEFHHLRFKPPFIPEDFLTAIRAALDLNPSCVIVDSMSDEHEGEGGYLDWHDAEVPKSGGNKWAAWAKPSASRRKLVAGFQQIGVPLLFTFRAREKTKQVGTKIVPVGFVPVAPAEIVHSLDLTCLLPPRASGQPVWRSSKEGEDFVIKLPEFLAPFIVQGGILNEDLGAALARWQCGETAPQGNGAKRSPEQMVDDYVAKLATLSTDRDLKAFQRDDKTVRWVAGLRDKGRADLLDRIMSADSRRLAELTPQEDERLDYGGTDDKGGGE